MLALASGAAPFSYTTVKVAEGVYAFVEPPGHAIVSGNTTVIVGDDGVAVVDTGHHPGLTRRMTRRGEKRKCRRLRRHSGCGETG